MCFQINARIYLSTQSTLASYTMQNSNVSIYFAIKGLLTSNFWMLGLLWPESVSLLLTKEKRALGTRLELICAKGFLDPFKCILSSNRSGFFLI